MAYNGDKLKEITLMNPAKALNFIRGRRKMYVVVGEDSGIVDFVDL